MKPLIVLLSVFTVSFFVIKLFRDHFKLALAGRIGMSAMLLFTAIGHFIFTDGMILMFPDFIPFKTEIVYLTGIMEILFAVGLLCPKYRKVTAWALIVFFIFVLPANIHASLKQVDYQSATFDGNGLDYLWFRIPLQLFFMIWTYFMAIKLD